jgi:hypothetical protein
MLPLAPALLELCCGAAAGLELCCGAAAGLELWAVAGAEGVLAGGLLVPDEPPQAVRNATSAAGMIRRRRLVGMRIAPFGWKVRSGLFTDITAIRFTGRR